jgi:transcription elongation factor GreA
MRSMKAARNRPLQDRDAATEALQQRIKLLGQLAAGLALIEVDGIPSRGAGYGSLVMGVELFSGRQHEYTLMLGALVDIDAGQVSLASPVGQALFGREVGDLVEIELPYRKLRLRIVRIMTINDLLADAMSRSERNTG